MTTTPTSKKPAPVPSRKPLVGVEAKPIEEPTPAKTAADAQAAQDAPKTPVKSPEEEIPPIPNNANGEPLYTMFSWVRKLRREGKIKE